MTSFPPTSPDVIADLETPVSLFARLRDSGANVLLDSTQQHAQRGRHSFIGFAENFQWFDSEADGLHALDIAHRWQARFAHHVSATTPFGGGLMFAGGGEFPFGIARVPTVGTIDVVTRSLWFRSSLEGPEDELRTRYHLVSALEQPSPLVPLNAPAATYSTDPEPWTATSRRVTRGRYDGDPFDLFRLVRAAAGRPFTGFIQDGRRAMFGSGAAPLITVKSRRASVWVPNGSDAQCVSPEALRVATTLDSVLDQIEIRKEPVELGVTPDAASFFGVPITGHVQDGKTVIDALSCAMLARGSTGPPLAGYVSWDGQVDTAVLEDSVTLRDRDYLAIAYTSGERPGALEAALKQAGGGG